MRARPHYNTDPGKMPDKTTCTRPSRAAAPRGRLPGARATTARGTPRAARWPQRQLAPLAHLAGCTLWRAGREGAGHGPAADPAQPSQGGASQGGAPSRAGALGRHSMRSLISKSASDATCVRCRVQVGQDPVRGLGLVWHGLQVAAVSARLSSADCRLAISSAKVPSTCTETSPAMARGLGSPALSHPTRVA